MAVHDFGTYGAGLRATANASTFGSDKNEPIGLGGTVLENRDLRRLDGGGRRRV
jgi:hypothetical protein